MPDEREAAAAAQRYLDEARSALDKAQLNLDRLVSPPKAEPAKPPRRPSSSSSSSSHCAVRGARDFGEPVHTHPLNA